MQAATKQGPAVVLSRFSAVRFVVVFLVLFGGLFALYSYSDWVREVLIQPWTRSVAAISTLLLRPIYPDVYRVGEGVLSSRFMIQVVDGCNGIEPLILLLAGILAFPTSLRARALGFAIGVPFVVLINQVRVLALFILGAEIPAWFDRSHIFIAQAFVILATAGFWLWWLGRFAVPPPARAAGDAVGAADGAGGETRRDGVGAEHD